MSKFIETLTEQLQLWLGETTSIKPRDVVTMVTAAQETVLQTEQAITLRIEGHPEDVARLVQMLKEILPATEHKANTAILPDGRVRRELNLEGQQEAESAARPGNLDPGRLTQTPPKPAQPERSPSEKLLFEALQTIARGLHEFPADDQGRRRFGSAYPATFKAGISKLNGYFLSKGLVFDDPIEFWRLLSKPLKDWPHMPPYLQSPDPFIDNDGRLTVLCQHLAKIDPATD
jgi:hypothetical protein